MYFLFRVKNMSYAFIFFIVLTSVVFLCIYFTNILNSPSCLFLMCFLLFFSIIISSLSICNFFFSFMLLVLFFFHWFILVDLPTIKISLSPLIFVQYILFIYSNSSCIFVFLFNFYSFLPACISFLFIINPTLSSRPPFFFIYFQLYISVIYIITLFSWVFFLSFFM